jgi:hypothetical protein
MMLAGCGSSSEERTLGKVEEDLLHRRLSDAREAASRHDAGAAVKGLRAFRRDVRRLRADGALSSTEARRLLGGAVQAEARAAAELKAPPPPQQAPAAALPSGSGGDEDEGD